MAALLFLLILVTALALCFLGLFLVMHTAYDEALDEIHDLKQQLRAERTPARVRFVGGDWRAWEREFGGTR